jgi:hypothetical protein
MATTTMVHIRVDEKVKADATKTLAAMGISVSDAVRILLALSSTRRVHGPARRQATPSAWITGELM